MKIHNKLFIILIVNNSLMKKYILINFLKFKLIDLFLNE